MLTLICLLVACCHAWQWSTWGGNNQHSGVSQAAAQPMNRLRMSFRLGGCETFQQHYGTPLVTSANTMITAFAQDCSGRHTLRAFYPNGTEVWSEATTYLLAPGVQSWVAQYQPVLAGEPGPSQRVYFADIGGQLRWRDNLDSPNGATGTIHYRGAQDYAQNRGLYDNLLRINSAIVAFNDAIYFTVRVSGTAPPFILTDTDVMVRIAGDGSIITKDSAYVGGSLNHKRFPNQFAMAFSNEGDLVYQVVGPLGDSTTRDVLMVALDPTTLTRLHSAPAYDPKFSDGTTLMMWADSTASPTVGPDGDVFMGFLTFGSLGRNLGWMLHWDKTLSTRKTPGGFGWDDTASIVWANASCCYTGTSEYLLFVKFNDYRQNAPALGRGQHRLVLLDPNDQTMLERRTGIPVMDEVQEILAPEPKFAQQPCDNLPGSLCNCALLNGQPCIPRREWCTSTSSFDPFTQSIHANNEDSYHYRWHLPSNTLAERVKMDDVPQEEAYTPSFVGPDGAVYAINKGLLAVYDSGEQPTTVAPEETTAAVTTTEEPTTESEPSTPSFALACSNPTVAVDSNFFDPLSLTVARGDIIRFDWKSGFHNVVQVATGAALDCTPVGFTSGPATALTGVQYSLHVGLPSDTYHYMCEPHCFQNMAAQFTVSGVCCGNPQDVNFDGVIDLRDLVPMIDLWGPCNGNEECILLDSDCNGQLNLEDLVSLVNTWGAVQL